MGIWERGVGLVGREGLEPSQHSFCRFLMRHGQPVRPAWGREAGARDCGSNLLPALGDVAAELWIDQPKHDMHNLQQQR